MDDGGINVGAQCQYLHLHIYLEKKVAKKIHILIFLDG